jgi:hypothetical protein
MNMWSRVSFTSNAQPYRDMWADFAKYVQTRTRVSSVHTADEDEAKYVQTRMWGER